MSSKQSVNDYIPPGLFLIIYLFITGGSVAGLTLLLIPFILGSLLLLMGAPSNLIGSILSTSFLSLGIYIIFYGMSVLDCGNSQNWFDLSDCADDVVSGIRTASVALGVVNLGLLIYGVAKRKSSHFIRFM